jgi:hypothetical protein
VNNGYYPRNPNESLESKVLPLNRRSLQRSDPDVIFSIRPCFESSQTFPGFCPYRFSGSQRKVGQPFWLDGLTTLMI